MKIPVLDRTLVREGLVQAIRRSIFGLVWIVAACGFLTAGPFTAWPEWEVRLLRLGTLLVVLCVVVSIVYALAPLWTALAGGLVDRCFRDDEASAPTGQRPHRDLSTRTQGE